MKIKVESMEEFDGAVSVIAAAVHSEVHTNDMLIVDGEEAPLLGYENGNVRIYGTTGFLIESAEAGERLYHIAIDLVQAGIDIVAENMLADYLEHCFASGINPNDTDDRLKFLFEQSRGLVDDVVQAVFGVSAVLHRLRSFADAEQNLHSDNLSSAFCLPLHTVLHISGDDSYVLQLSLPDRDSSTLVPTQFDINIKPAPDGGFGLFLTGVQS